MAHGANNRYLGQFDRVRHCLRQGMDTAEIAHVLNCSISLVEVYQQVVAEYDGTDTLLRKFIYGPGIDNPIVMIQ